MVLSSQGARRKKKAIQLRLSERHPSNLPRILRRFYIAIGVLLAVVLLGSVGFWFIGEGHSTWSDALYMTLITVTTVGYSEIVPLTTVFARVFANVVAIVGFGTLTFLFTSLTVFFLETDLDYTLRRRRMEKSILKLRGHYIVCGFGRVGRNVAKELQHTGRSFVVIDPEEAKLTSQLEHFPNLLYLPGDASDDDLLLAANIEEARGVFALTADDSRNLMIALTARQLNPQVRVVTRCQDVRNTGKLKKAGADAIISPDFTGGMRIAAAMVRPQVVGFLDEMLRSEHRLRVEEFVVPPGFHTRPFGDLAARGVDYIIVAVRHDHDWTFNPPASFPLCAGHILIAMVTPSGRHELEQLLLA